MATVNELVTAFGFELKPDAIKNINNVEVGISHLQDAIGKLGRMLTGGMSMKDYFGSALGRSQDIVNSARAIGMSTDALQEWQYAAKASGVSAESVISDIENLRANFFMSEKGMLRLADSFKKMSAGGAYWYGNMYGLSKDTVLMLRQGSAALKQMQEEAHKMGAITPQEELIKAAKLNADLEKRKVALQKIVDTIVLKVTPAVTKLFEKFDTWLAEDPGRAELIIQGISLALAGLASAQILSGIGEFINLIKSFGVGLVSLSPGGVILAGISAAVYGLYKDFQNFKNGGESLLPWDTIIKDFEIAADKIANVIDGIKDKWNKFKAWLKSEEGQQTEKTVKGYANAVWDAEKELVKGSLTAAKDLVNWGGAFIGGALNTPGGIFRPFSMLDNALRTGNLALQNAQTLKDAGLDKYFGPNLKSLAQPKELGTDQYMQMFKTTAQNAENIQSMVEKIVNQNTPEEAGMKPSFDIQSMIDGIAAKSLSNEVGIKPASIRGITEALREITTAPAPSPAPTVRDANFNGANINIITGASSEDIIDALTSLGGNLSESYSGLGYMQ